MAAIFLSACCKFAFWYKSYAEITEVNAEIIAAGTTGDILIGGCGAFRRGSSVSARCFHS